MSLMVSLLSKVTLSISFCFTCARALVSREPSGEARKGRTNFTHSSFENNIWASAFKPCFLHRRWWQRTAL